MKFCNNVKGAVHPTAKRGAPAISLDEFKKILTDYYNMSYGSGDINDYYTEATDKESFIKDLFQNRSSVDCPEFYSEMRFFSDNPATTAIKAVDPANNLLGLKVLDSDIPIYGFLMGGEHERPFFVVLYWNGKHLRFFIPEFGNTINMDFFTGFGSEAYSAADSLEELIIDYEEFLHKSLEDVVCLTCKKDELDFMAPGIAYCLKNKFADTEEEAYKIMNTVSWDEMLNEIYDFIEESEIDSSETVIVGTTEYEDEDEDFDY